MEGCYMLKHRLIAMIMVVSVLTGCSNVKFTTGLNRDEFAKISGQKVDMQLAQILLSETKYSYETIFNDQVWSKEVDDVTMENHVKNEVRNTIESIVYAREMALDMNIYITNDEKQRIKEAAKEYMSYYEDTECDFDEKGVETLYEWLLLAEKGFYAITDDVDTKVSTDEARLIQVQYMFFEKTDSGKEEAEYISGLLSEGKEFVSLAMEYSDDENYILELSRGEYIREFEETAFNLESGAVSDIVDTPFGYYILKCTNYNLEADYDKQAKKVVFARRKQIFTDKYIEYADGKSGEYNKRFWKKNPIDKVCKGSGELYNIYTRYFVSTRE